VGYLSNVGKGRTECCSSIIGCPEGDWDQRLCNNLIGRFGVKTAVAPLFSCTHEKEGVCYAKEFLYLKIHGGEKGRLVCMQSLNDIGIKEGGVGG